MVRMHWSYILAAWTLVPAALHSETLEINEPILVKAQTTEVAPLPIESVPSWQEPQLELQEVVLERNSTLILPPFKSVVINLLIASEGSKIQFAQSQEQGEDPQAASARIFVRNIRGHILLESRGMDGADGRPGRHGRQGAEGRRGRNARTLLFGLIWLGDGEDGGPGLAGEIGEAGENGAAGGNGGDISLYYVDKTLDSKVVVDVSGGAAGRGGRGGLGGLGGNGGRGGEGIRDGKQGPMGLMGPSGLAGLPGKPGLPGKASIYQIPSSLFFCLMELDARALAETLRDEDYDQCREGLDASAIRSVPQDSKSIVMDIDGVFYLNADGQSGKNSPPAVGSGASPENATSGSHGGNLTLLFQDLPERALISATGGKGGQGADGRAGISGGDGLNGRSGSLFRKATAGTNGQNGQNGGNGSHGGHGGAGGSIKIIYIPRDASSYQADWVKRFEVDVSGGSLGLAGRGAEGGRAGRGGLGGKKFWSKERLPDGQEGTAGLRGISGQDGEAGPEGQVEFLEADHLSDWIIDAFRREVEASHP